MCPKEQIVSSTSGTCKTVYGGTDSTKILGDGEPSDSEPVGDRSAEGCWGSFRSFVSDAKFEILVFVTTFSMAVSRVSSTSLILDKSCLVYYGYPEDICGNLQNYTSIKSSVEKVSANYQLAYTLIRTISSIIISLFIGPWSDTYGRKMPLRILMVTTIIEFSIGAVCSHFIKSPIEYYLIGALIGGLGGSSTCLSTMFYCLVGDLATKEGRTVKFAFFEVAAGLATSISIASGGWIYNAIGYTYVFVVAASGLSFAFLWLSVFPETRGLNNKDPCTVKLKKFFSFKTFLESVTATVKKRPLNGRREILLLIASLCIVHTVQLATIEINFLYAHHQFDWNNTQFSNLFAFYYLLSIVLLWLTVPLLKRFKVGDSAIGQIGTGSLIAKYLTMGLAWKISVYHTAYVLGLLSSASFMAFRSRLSKVVSKDDSGKVFAFVATAEAVVPVIATVTFSQLFNAFLDIYPGTPYFFIVFITVLPFSVAIWIKYLPDVVYNDIEGKNQENSETRSSHMRDEENCL